MSYTLSGYFVEACDCTVICPCWVDDDPVGGHCTGMIAWQIESGKINGIAVDGCRVVSVSTHQGNRRASSNTVSVLYIDAAASDDQYRELTGAFAGDIGGPLGELRAVSGEVAGTERAVVTIADGNHGQWTVTAHPPAVPDVPVISATGAPQVFDEGPNPLTLQHTALAKELGVPADAPAVTAQAGHTFSVNVGGLPAGTLRVTGRSGMRGRFCYQFQDHGRDRDDDDQH
jgi:hypothetical protein